MQQALSSATILVRMKEQAAATQPLKNNNSTDIQAIIFDMDGTLLESTEADYLAWEKIFERYDNKLTYEKYVTMLGIRSADVIRDFLGFTDAGDVSRILVEKFNCFVEVVNEKPVKPVDSADKILKAAHASHLKVALATSSRKEKMQLLLTQLDFLQYFHATVTGEEVERSKPAPDIFLKAAERLGIPPANCVVVEDGPIGITAAKKAGMKCIAITATTEPAKLQEADLVIESYDDIDLEELLARL